MRFRSLFFACLLIAILTAVAAAPAAASHNTGNTGTTGSSAACGPSVTYVVQPGDTLFRIAQRFNTTVRAIANANNIANVNRIYWGTTLVIPCPGAPQVPAPPPVVPIPAGPVVRVFPPFTAPPVFVNCSLLSGTSPLDGLAYGDNTFYWNPVPGATGYRINVYNLDMGGQRVATFEAPGTQTSLVGHVGANAGTGFQFAWEVQALVSDFVVCSTPRYHVLREAP